MDALFQKLGFSPNEARAYLTLAETGKASATEIAKRARFPRSTAYSVLNSLVARGMVASEQDVDAIYYVPNPPSTFSLILKTEVEEAQRKLEENLGIAAELEQLVAPYFKQSTFSIPKILFFEGKKNVEAMLYAHAKEWQRQIAKYDYTWWGYQDIHFVESYRKWLDNYWEGLQPKEKIYLLSNRSSLEKKLQGKVQRRIIKTLPKGFEFSCTIWALGDTVVLIMTRHEPNYAVLISDAVFAANQRQLFQLLWQLIK